jgi:hypothetical protein
MTAVKNSGKGARMKQFWSPCLAAVSLTALAACSSDPATTAPMFCPSVAVLQQAQNLTSFEPGRTDVAAQITTAQITGVAGSCTLEPDKHLLHVKFQAGFAASNGPANHGAPLSLPYFVAITDGQNIISKSDYSIPLSFDGNESIAQATTKPIKIDLSNRRANRDIQVLIGFELTQDELDYAASHPAVSP